jgi:hypothetical protein
MLGNSTIRLFQEKNICTGFEHLRGEEAASAILALFAVHVGCKVEGLNSSTSVGIGKDSRADA